MNARIPRILLAGTGSGAGKTAMACALLAALKQRGLNPAAFKCGPDYIDPMFHESALGVPSRNLDSFLCGDSIMKFLLAENARGRGIAVIEGVMGLYDGLGATDDCSSNHIARLTSTPALLVAQPAGQALSLAAQVKGYLDFLPNTVRGVLLSRVKPGMYPFYKGLLEDRLGVPVLGYLPPLPEAEIASRHLGLVTPGELADIKERMEAVGRAALESLDVEAILNLAGEAAPLEYESPALRTSPLQTAAPVRIGVARDRAFCFYYEDSLDLLRRLGAELVPFSPLADAALPEHISGLLLGGGYPEEAAHELSANASMRESVRRAAENGLPVLAECGGYMYLCRSLTTHTGAKCSMAGVIGADARMTESLSRFGYIRLTAQQDSPFCAKGSVLRAHEFHYSDSTDNGAALIARRPSGAEWPCMHLAGPRKNVLAGYPHLHLWGNIELAEGFVAACREYAASGGAHG